MQPPTQNNSQQDLDLRVRTMRTLWLALMASVGMYLLFTLIVGRPANLQSNSTLSLALLGVTVLITLLSFFVRKWLVSKAVARRQVPMVQQAYIATWALAEIGGLLGMLDFFATSDRYYYVFFLIAVGAQLLHFPRREDVVNASYGPSGL